MKISALMLATALASGALGAQAATTKQTHTARRTTAAREAPGTVDPAAVEALTKMSAYLRSLPAFQITLATQRDDVDVYGQLITLSGGATYSVRRPDRLAIDIAMPTLNRQYFYNGKTVTVFDPRTRYFARFDAPSAIGPELLHRFDQYGVPLPLADLFTWTEGDPRAAALTSAHYIGKAVIDGQNTRHYAYRQRGVDWQIWIADGDRPAPVRVALVDRGDPARPKFQADLAWNTAPHFGQDAFAFNPPPNARMIQIRPVQP